MRVLSVVGARPQFVKLAPVHRALTSAGHEHIIVHTGQHYDRSMSEIFFEDLGIPEPNVNLEVGSGSHGQQTGAMLTGLETAFIQYQPDWILVYGDTNSTLAAAIAAVKLHLPLAHLEAGLRSFNRLMPEEHNRVLTDHASDLLLPPTEVAMRNLKREGLSERAVIVGDVMTDVCFATRDAVRTTAPAMPANWVDDGDYLVSTIHRQENTDDADRLQQVIAYLSASDVEIRLLAHPRLINKATEFGLDLLQGNIRVFEPLAYPQLVYAVMNSKGVVTDSGGLQKEAFLLGKPCLTIRTETEWVETVEAERNVLVPNCDIPVVEALSSLSASSSEMPYGNGQAAVHTVAALENWLQQRD